MGGRDGAAAGFGNFGYVQAAGADVGEFEFAGVGYADADSAEVECGVCEGDLRVDAGFSMRSSTRRL